MATLKKVIKVTKAQYNILSSGGRVGDYVGLNDDYLYLIEDNTEYVDITTVDFPNVATYLDWDTTYTLGSVAGQHIRVTMPEAPVYSWSDIPDAPSTFPPSAHNHAASEITSGVLADARIPNLNASKIASGTFTVDRIPNIPLSKITDVSTIGTTAASTIAYTTTMSGVTTASPALVSAGAIKQECDYIWTSINNINDYCAWQVDVDKIDLTVSGNVVTFTNAAGQSVSFTTASAWSDITGKPTLSVSGRTVTIGNNSTTWTNTAGLSWDSTNHAVKSSVDSTSAVIPTATTSTQGIIAIGTAATQAAAGNHNHDTAYAAKGHTHTTSLAASTGTPSITLSHGGKYVLSTGGTAYTFQMPAQYSHPTYTAQTAGLFKIGRDATGHVVIGDAFTIPTVNNASLTIQKNGTTIKTFTANASTNVTCNITVPTVAADVGALPTGTTLDSIADGSTRKLANYLPLSGGTMTGPLKWSGGTALPQQTTPQYIVCIDAFADGGTTKWTSIADLKSALGSMPPSAHTHSISQITDVSTIGTTAVSTVNISTSSASIASGNSDLVTGGAIYSYVENEGGKVKSISIDGTTYNPTNGVITLPTYPVIPSTYAWTSITGKPTLSISGNTVTIGNNSTTWTNTTYTLSVSGNSISLNGSDSSVDTKTLDNLNADTVDLLHLNDQGMAYKGQSAISIGFANAIVQTGLSESQIFALTGYRYGQLYLASDTQRYWRRWSTATTASSSYWRNDTAEVTSSLQLPNQFTTEDAIYIKLDVKQMYYSGLTKFYVQTGYENISGTTTVIGFCRQANYFDITSCSYNGNNLLGVYQASSNTDIYYFKFRAPNGSYGGQPGTVATIRIKYNYYSDTPTITFISKNNSQYNTVKSYSYTSVPSFGNKRSAINYSLIPIGTSQSLGNSSLPWANVYGTTIYENGTSLVNKYAAKSHSHTAADVGALPTGTTLDGISDGNTRKLSNYLLKTDIADWAKAANKPTYTASEVGALPSTTTYLKSISKSGPTYTITNSANGTTTWTIPTVPTKVSAFTNDAGYLTTVAWGDVTGKPSTFTPTAHTHSVSDITDVSTIGTTAVSTLNLSTTVNSSSTDSQIPTAKAVWTVANAAGKVKEIQINGTTQTISSSGVVNLPAYPTIPSTYAWTSITGKPTLSISGRTITIGDNSTTWTNTNTAGLSWDATNHAVKSSLDSTSAVIPTATTSAQGIIAIGTAATQAAAGNHTHSAYVNQNAYGNVKVGSTTTAAGSTTDTITFAAGGNLSVGINGKTITYSVTLPTQLPASDVSAWAKAASKPTYNFSEIYAGNVTVGDGANTILLRTNGGWASGIYHQTTQDEAVVFLNKGKDVSDIANYSTSWIFAYGDPTTRPTWTSLAPVMQIKENGVVINKLLTTKVGPAYNLDVNGTANATTVYEGGSSLSTKYAAKSHTHTLADITDSSTCVTKGMFSFNSSTGVLTIDVD